MSKDSWNFISASNFRMGTNSISIHLDKIIVKGLVVKVGKWTPSVN